MSEMNTKFSNSNNSNNNDQVTLNMIMFSLQQLQSSVAQMNNNLQQLSTVVNQLVTGTNSPAQSTEPDQGSEDGLQKRISKRIAQPNKHGKRDIRSSAKKAIEARQRHSLTSSRRMKDMADATNVPSKVYLNDKLAALIDQLYYEKHQGYPDAEFRKKAILNLREYARHTHIQMENDGFINIQWNDLDDDIKMYYALIVEDI
ncbi:uncharacterized protein RHIMIDRAFT_316937, partial [Rhizopus microsporus ATCC 52813]